MTGRFDLIPEDLMKTATATKANYKVEVGEPEKLGILPDYRERRRTRFQPLLDKASTLKLGQGTAMQCGLAGEKQVRSARGQIRALLIRNAVTNPNGKLVVRAAGKAGVGIVCVQAKPERAAKKGK